MPRLVEALPKYRKHKDRLIAEWLQHGRRAPVSAAEAITVTILCARYLRFARGSSVKDGECTCVVPASKCAIEYLTGW